MARRSRRPDPDPLVCFCNEVRRSTIQAAIENGADTLAALFDATWAGCGPCGGSCQPDLVSLLERRDDPHLNTGQTASHGDSEG